MKLMLNFRRPIFVRLFLVFVLALTFLHVLPVYAEVELPSGREDEWCENGILFYNPDGQLKSICGSYNYGTTKPTGDQITWVGDSYTVRAEDGYDHLISKKLPGTDIHAKSSKHWYMDADESAGGESGLTILRNLGEIRRYVVFALGTNDQSGLISGGNNYIQDLEDIVGPDRTIILVTPRTYDYTYETVISQMKDAATSYPNIVIADWASAVEEDLDTYFTASSDTIHPNEKGTQLWVDTIYNALPGGAGTLSGSSNAEMIWNYFVSAGISGVSDNPAAIAGILGNLFQESGFDPYIVGGSGYYGIYQHWKDYGGSELKAYVDQAVGGNSASYWHTLGQKATAPQDAINIALKAELDYLTQQNTRFIASGTSYAFLRNLDKVSEQSPESYAELFEVCVEGATGSVPLQDTGVRNFAQQTFKTTSYQSVNERRSNARKVYDSYMNGGSIKDNLASVSTSPDIILGMTKATDLDYSISKTTSKLKDSFALENSTKIKVQLAVSGSGTGVNWSDGWIVDGTMPGYTKQPLEGSSYTPGESFHKGGWKNSEGKPNKILLHNTEGEGIGLAAYQGSDGKVFPAHFTIDVKKKQVTQHFPITEPAMATASGPDDYGPIQIEIVGWKYGTHTDSQYSLSNFTNEEWDYLALLMTAIAEATGIQLTSSVSWEDGTPRFSSLSEFGEATGVVGHMHAPLNTHTDPGNIWPKVQEALSRNPNASQFQSGGSSANNQYCPDDSYFASGGSAALISGGMTLDEANNFMKDYINLQNVTTNVTKNNETHVFDGVGIYIYHSGCTGGPLSNCSSFSQYFVNRYTTKGPHISAVNGDQFVNYLINDFGFGDNGGNNHIPKLYSVFSKTSVHTGVVLGIDAENDILITGEASCQGDLSTTHAYQYKLSDWTNNPNITYAYTDGILKGGI